MKIRVRGMLYEIASIQVLGLGTTVSVQWIDPIAGIMQSVLSVEEFQAVIVWGYET